MPAPIPLLRRFDADESQPGLVDQGRRLQRLARLLLGHFLNGQLAKFVVNQRQKLLRREAVPLFGGGQDVGQFTHELQLPVCSPPTSAYRHPSANTRVSPPV